MSDSAEPKPASQALTEGVRVEVWSKYIAEHSRPEVGQWVFGYAVRITNEGEETVKLVSRHWVITDGNGEVEEVKGPGVVGEQPMLFPGDSHEYTSFCPLATPVGSMEGSYQMVTGSGETFDAQVAEFPLSDPRALN